jgi:hypothetical protein
MNAVFFARFTLGSAKRKESQNTPDEYHYAFARNLAQCF